jgi:hypothetical protein
LRGAGVITASLFRVFFLPSELQSDYAAKLNANGSMREFGAEGDTPLLWVIREQLGRIGTKYGCGIAQCGACTVHINGTATRRASAAATSSPRSSGPDQ